MIDSELSRYFRQSRGKRGYIWRGVYKLPVTRASGIDRPWVAKCPAPMCFYSVSAKTETEADIRLKTHTCPWYGGGNTTLSWGVMSDHFLKPIWEKLDKAVDELMAHRGEDPLPPGYVDHDLTRYEGTARGIAEALAILMPPFFTTGDEIVREAMVRYKKRKAGEEYETPGIGRLKFAQPPGAELITASGLPRTPEYDPTAPKHRLPEEAVKKILAATAAGFTPDMLAPAYGVSVAVIKGIVKDGR